jgi:hypothetical protein
VSETPSPETPQPQESLLGSSETFDPARPAATPYPSMSPAHATPAPTSSADETPAPTPSADATPTPPAAPTPKARRIGIIAAVAVAAIALLAVAGWFYLGRTKPVDAQVGQCLAGTTIDKLDANKLKIVDCTASDASFKVVQRVEGKTDAESNSACPSAVTEYVYWSGRSEGAKGTVLCLVTVKK